MRWTFLIPGLFALSVVAAPEGPSPPILPDSGEAAVMADSSSLAGLFRDVALAWRTGEPDPLARHLGRRGVYLSLQRDEVLDGRFSANQAEMILRNVLGGAATERFEFTRFRNLDGGGGRPNGVALWVRDGAGGELVREIVFVSVGREAGRWTLAEIRQRVVRVASG